MPKQIIATTQTPVKLPASQAPVELKAVAEREADAWATRMPDLIRSAYDTPVTKAKRKVAIETLNAADRWSSRGRPGKALAEKVYGSDTLRTDSRPRYEQREHFQALAALAQDPRLGPAVGAFFARQAILGRARSFEIPKLPTSEEIDQAMAAELVESTHALIARVHETGALPAYVGFDREVTLMMNRPGIMRHVEAALPAISALLTGMLTWDGQRVTLSFGDTLDERSLLNFGVELSKATDGKFNFEPVLKVLENDPEWRASLVETLIGLGREIPPELRAHLEADVLKFGGPNAPDPFFAPIYPLIQIAKANGEDLGTLRVWFEKNGSPELLKEFDRKVSDPNYATFEMKPLNTSVTAEEALKSLESDLDFNFSPMWQNDAHEPELLLLGDPRHGDRAETAWRKRLTFQLQDSEKNDLAASIQTASKRLKELSATVPQAAVASQRFEALLQELVSDADPQGKILDWFIAPYALHPEPARWDATHPELIGSYLSAHPLSEETANSKRGAVFQTAVELSSADISTGITEAHAEGVLKALSGSREADVESRSKALEHIKSDDLYREHYQFLTKLVADAVTSSKAS
jgi:hypothetical protein